MTANRRFTLDSNLLVYASDRQGGDRIVPRMISFTALATSTARSPLQALGEFFYVTTRKFKVLSQTAAKNVNAWRDVFSGRLCGRTT